MNTDKHRLTKLMVAAIVVLVLMTGHALAQPCGGYEVTAIIQTPVDCGFGFDITTGLGLNDDGAVVGYYWCSGWEHKEAFVWTAEEGFVTLERPQGVVSARAVDINDEGIICGTAVVSGLGNRGFVYGYEGDQFTILGTLPGGNWSEAHAIDSAGEIVGFWGDTINGPSPLAFIWRDGELIDIHPDFGTIKSEANGINDDGVLTGWMGTSTLTDARAFIWDNGKVTELPLVPNGVTAKGEAINERGYVAGEGRVFLDDGKTMAVQSFLWADNQMTNLGTLPGTTFARARGINDQNRIAGYCHNAGLVDLAPFIWQDGLMTNINDLLPSDSQLTVYLAQGINNAGQIAGSATTDFSDLVAVLLTPIQGPPGDLTDDCQVGVADLLILLADWGPCDNCVNCPADLNSDCVVGVKDLLILLGNWG